MGDCERIVTVTVNPAIDQTLVIPGFSAGAVNRVQSSRTDAGGKGINVASFLSDFGLPATVTGFLGAENDLIFRRLFGDKGIEDRCIRIAGATRTGLKITDPALQETTDINFPGETPGPADIQRLFATLAELASSRDWFVLSGSIPREVSGGIYAEMLRALAGCRVVLDTSGESLRCALAAGPTIVKPNVEELAELMGRPLTSQDAILAAGRELIDRHGIATVVVSMGKEGALFVEGNAALSARPPQVEVISTVGAGDAMVAGIVVGKVRGLSLAGTARLATAFSAAAITRPGHNLPDSAAIEALQRQVTLTPLA